MTTTTFLQLVLSTYLVQWLLKRRYLSIREGSAARIYLRSVSDELGTFESLLSSLRHSASSEGNKNDQIGR